MLASVLSCYLCFLQSIASDIASERVGRKWGTLVASKLDLFQGARNGRLLRYKPESDEVDVLANGIWFANGIGMDKDEKFIVVS
jgi:sugar lactone lactonase YvrE